jgi:hypothetical protein
VAALLLILAGVFRAEEVEKTVEKGREEEKHAKSQKKNKVVILVFVSSLLSFD